MKETIRQTEIWTYGDHRQTNSEHFAINRLNLKEKRKQEGLSFFICVCIYFRERKQAVCMSEGGAVREAEREKPKKQAKSCQIMN